MIGRKAGGRSAGPRGQAKTLLAAKRAKGCCSGSSFRHYVADQCEGRRTGRVDADSRRAANKTAVQPLTTATVVIIFLFFILLGRESFRDRTLRLAGSGRIRMTTAAVKDASSRVSRFLQISLVDNICYRGSVGLVLRWIGIPRVLLWAVLPCILRFVP